MCRTLLAFLLLLPVATNAWAQATAQINGTVADGSGGVLPGATVIAIQTDTGFRREAVTDDGVVYAAEPADRTLSSRSDARRLPHLRRRRASCCRSTATPSSP